MIDRASILVLGGMFTLLLVNQVVCVRRTLLLSREVYRGVQVLNALGAVAIAWVPTGRSPDPTLDLLLKGVLVLVVIRRAVETARRRSQALSSRAGAVKVRYDDENPGGPSRGSGE